MPIKLPFDALVGTASSAPWRMPASASSMKSRKMRIAQAIDEKTDLISRLTRWREWFDTKFPLYLAGLCYAVLRNPSSGVPELGAVAWLLLMYVSYASFGHVINDYSDRAADAAAGKKRPIADLGQPVALSVIATLAIAPVLVSATQFDLGTTALAAASVLLASLYSLPPLRLKERGLLAWGAATLAQRTLPFAVGFQALGAWDWATGLMCILGTLIGLRYIIVHQLMDRPNDLRSGIRTAATEYNPGKIARLLTHWLFPLEVATACATILAMSAVTLAAPVAAALYGVLALSYWRSKQAFSPLSHGIFREFYYFLWPVCLAGALVLRNPLFTPMLLLAVALGYRIAAGSLRGFTFMKKIGMKTTGDFRISSPLAGEFRRHRPKFEKSDPYPYYADLRARGAVHRIAWSQLGLTYVITRHKTALAIFKDPRFVKDVRNIALPDGSTRSRPGPTRGFGPDMLELDPPDHTRLRKLVSKAFTSRVIDQLQLRVEKSANEILDSTISKGEMEFVSEFASTISIRVISQILGLRIVNIDGFRRFAYALSLSQTKRQAIPSLEARKAQFTKQLVGVLERRRKEPQDDLVSSLVHAEQDGDRLSPEELLGMVYFLLLAGFVTTQNLMANGTLALLRHPDQFEALRGNPGLAGSAVEEFLRFDSPLELSSVHFASRNVEVEGVGILSGSPVRVIIPSVNRDENEFERPDVLDIARKDCAHLSFAHGVHYCLGAALARMEARVAFQVLLEKAPGLRLADPENIQWLGHPVLRGLQRLPLRF